MIDYKVGRTYKRIYNKSKRELIFIVNKIWDDGTMGVTVLYSTDVSFKEKYDSYQFSLTTILAETTEISRCELLAKVL